jgi:hypothetical protein
MQETIKEVPIYGHGFRLKATLTRYLKTYLDKILLKGEIFGTRQKSKGGLS